MAGASAPTDPEQGSVWVNEQVHGLRGIDQQVAAGNALAILGLSFRHRYDQIPFPLPSTLFEALSGRLDSSIATMRAAALALAWLSGGNRAGTTVHWRPSESQIDNLVHAAMDRTNDAHPDPITLQILAGICGRQRAKCAVGVLVVWLSNPSAMLRESAAKALGNIGDARAAEPLIGSLEDKASQVRRAAAEALSEIRDERAVAPLITALNDGSPEVQLAAVWALGQQKSEEAVGPLIAALNRCNPEVQRAVVEVLGRMRTDHAIGSLRVLLKEGDVKVRRGVVGALERIGGASAVELLINGLADSDLQVRSAAARALGHLKDENAVDCLLLHLQEDEAEGRSAVAWALGQIKSQKAVEPLKMQLTHSAPDVRRDVALALFRISRCAAEEAMIPLLQDPSAENRRIAALVLGHCESEKAIDPLVRLTDDKALQVRDAAIWALGQSKSERSVEALVGQLSAGDAQAKCGAARALGPIRSERAIGPLLTALKDADAEVRRTVVQALAEIKNERALEQLIVLLDDADYEARRLAINALGQMRSRRACDALTGLLQVLSAEDQCAELKSGAARALGQIGGERALEALITLLQDNDEGVRLAATRALGAAKREGSVDMIVAELGASEPARRAAAATALGWIGEGCVEGALRTALRDEAASVKISAALALTRIGLHEASRDGIETLIGIAQGEEDPSVRGLAGTALDEIPAEPFFRPVVEALDTADNERALSLLEPRLSARPHDLEGRWYRGLVLARLSHHEDAIDELRAVVDQAPSVAEAHHVLAASFAALDRAVEAVAAAERAVGAEPDNATYHVDLGWYAFKAGDYRRAVACSMRAIELDPSLHVAWFNLALAHLALGDMSGAQQRYSEALQALRVAVPDNAALIVSEARADLEGLAESRPDLRQTIAAILTTFPSLGSGSVS
jgi:HEAT repeat protein/Flp pilus assembly protein TadD